MTTTIYVILLLLLAATAVILRKTYFFVSTRELKRQADRGDDLAHRLYRAVAYEGSLQAFLWLIIGFSTAGAVIILARSLPAWQSIFIIALLLAVLFIWLPSGRLSRVGTRVTLIFTPSIAWLLNYLHPALGRAATPMEKRHDRRRHTGVYEKEDMQRFIDRQGKQADNRLSSDELDAVQRALAFGDQTVADALIPRKQVKTISASETVGPILIDELHKLEQPFVLVAGSSKDDIIGILPTTRLGIKSSGNVRDHMDKVAYLNAKTPLIGVFQAFQTTGQSLFIVINDFEEFTGLITVEAVMEQLVGALPEDDFEEYDNLSAVAAHDPALKIDDDVVEEADGELEDADAEQAEEPKAEEEEPLANDPESSSGQAEPEEIADEDSDDEEDESAEDKDDIEVRDDASEVDAKEPSDDTDGEAEESDDTDESKEVEANEDSELDETETPRHSRLDREPSETKSAKGTPSNGIPSQAEDDEDDSSDSDDEPDAEIEDDDEPTDKLPTKPVQKTVHIARTEKLNDDPDFESIEVSD